MRWISLLLITFLFNPAQGWTQEPVAENRMPSTTVDSAQIKKEIQQADSLVKIGKLHESIVKLKKAKVAADSIGDANLIQSVGLKLVSSYLDSDQSKLAEEDIRQMLDRYPNSDKKAELLSKLGGAYGYQGKYDSALVKLHEAKALTDSLESPALFGDILSTLGVVHTIQGNYGDARKYLLRSMKIYENGEYKWRLATLLNNIGWGYSNQNKLEKANYYLKRALKVDKEIGNKLGLLRVTNNLALNLQNQGKLEQALDMLKKALTLNKEVRKGTPPFRQLYNMGQVYMEMGKLDRAEEYHNKSLSYCKEAGIKPGLVYNYNGLADVAKKRKNYDIAEEQYLKSLDIAEKINLAKLRKEVLSKLYSLMKKARRYNKALHYHEELTALTDSLDNIAQQEKLKETETKLGLKKQQRINTLLKEKQKQQETRITTQNWLIAVGIIIICVIAVLLYLLYKANADNKRINEELVSQRNKLQELNNVKEKILAIIAHDLRSPLTSVVGIIELIRDKSLTEEELEELLIELEFSIDQNVSMIDNLLHWARQQMSGQDTNIESVDAKTLIDSTIENHKVRAKNKNVHLLMDAPEGLCVKADAELLKVVIRNLLSNAIKFTNSGDQISINAKKQDSDTVEFRVEDTGIGIAEEDQAQLFSTYGVSRNGTSNESGSGLGLQLCKEFVEKLNGTIEFESTKGEGTTFRFTLPLSE